jgi:hypothetical protein
MMAMNMWKIDLNCYLDSNATAHVTRDAQQFNWIHKVEFASVKFATSHSHKMHGEGNIVVSYKGRTKNVHNVIYVFKCEEKFVVYRHFSRHGLCSHVWNT